MLFKNVCRMRKKSHTKILADRDGNVLEHWKQSRKKDEIIFMIGIKKKRRRRRGTAFKT